MAGFIPNDNSKSVAQPSHAFTPRVVSETDDRLDRILAAPSFQTTVDEAAKSQFYQVSAKPEVVDRQQEDLDKALQTSGFRCTLDQAIRTMHYRSSETVRALGADDPKLEIALNTEGFHQALLQAANEVVPEAHQRETPA